MAHAAAGKKSKSDALGALGLRPAWAAAFRAAAVQRAPYLAGLYGSTLMDAYRRAGQVLAPPSPRWREAWPKSHQGAITLAHSLEMAADCIAHLSPHFRASLTSAFRRRCLRLRAGPARTITRPFRPPQMQLAFDGGLPAALTLAHELGHWLQMGGADGVSRRPPALAAAETGALVVERLMLQALAKTAPKPAYAIGCDDALAMLVRHPARDAWAQAGGSPLAWRAAAARFAPGLDWSIPPRVPDRRDDPPGRVLAYAMAAAIAAPIATCLTQDAAARDAFAAWLRQGPEASLLGVSSLLPADLDDPALYLAAYADAETWIESPPDD